MKKTYSDAQMAKRLGLGTEAVQRLAREGIIPCVRTFGPGTTRVYRFTDRAEVAYHRYRNSMWTQEEIRATQRTAEEEHDV